MMQLQLLNQLFFDLRLAICGNQIYLGDKHYRMLPYLHQYLYQFYQMQLYQDQEKVKLMQTPKPTDTPTQEVKEVIHKVQYGDTLEGISLEYSVPLSKIKFRNSIEGDYIYHLRQIIIPNPQTAPISKEVTEEMLIEEFLANMNYSEKDRKVARYYLVQADWNFDNAIKQYRSDLEWERKNKQEIKIEPIIQTKLVQTKKPEVNQIPRFYQMQDLRHKKTN